MDSLCELMRQNEAAFLESLEAIISQNGSTQQSCIAQLRALNLPDDFWMYVFKVVPCSKTYSHKWTLCPCAHAGETARRRDPRVVKYRAVLCPIVKGKKTCPLGDSCSYAHNVFEHWLHPSRYKTRLCSFGRNCNRPICFFAHSADELRCVPNADDGKDMDEREYMLQLMMAQGDAGGSGQGAGGLQTARSLGANSLPATPLNGMQSLNAFCPSTPIQGPYSSYIDPLTSPLQSPQGPGGQQLPNTAAQLAAQQAQLASYLNATAPIRVKPSLHPQHSLPAQLMAAASGNLGLQDAALQLMGLQEALAAINLQEAMDPSLGNVGNMHGSLSVGATPLSQVSRASDPGLANQNNQDALKMLQGMASNRISDTGQPAANLGPLTSPQAVAAGLESLLPFLQAPQAPQPPQPQTPAAERRGSGSGYGGFPSLAPARDSSASLGSAAAAPIGSGRPARPGSPSAMQRTLSPTESQSTVSGSPSNNPSVGIGELQSQPSLATQGSGITQGLVGTSSNGAETAPADAAAAARTPSADQAQESAAQHMSFQRQLSDPSAMLAFAPGPVSTPRTATAAAAAGSAPARASLPRAMSVGPGPLFSPTSSSAPQQNQFSFMQQQHQHQQAAAAAAAAQQQQQQQQQALQALMAVSAGDANVDKLVSDLQQQGMTGAKEQLVASLSNLLAQLLSSPGPGPQ